MDAGMIKASKGSLTVPVVSEMKTELENILSDYKSVLEHVIGDRSTMVYLLVQNTEAKIKKMQEKYFLVEQTDLNGLTKEIKMMKDILPKTLNKELLNAPLKLKEKEAENQTLSLEKKSLERENQLMKKRYEYLLSEVDREKQDNVELRQHVSELTAITTDQSEYCAKLGGATCALLWRVSQQDGCMQAMLNGDTGAEFIQMAFYTLESFSAALNDNRTKLDKANDEQRFVLALIGVVTNISASAYGREFLITCAHGKELLSVLITLLSDAPMKENKWMKLRNLILRTLYNMSINQKGLKFLCSKKDIFQTFASVVEGDKCADSRLQAVRFIQSIVLEPECVEAIHIVLEILPLEKLRCLCQSARGEVQQSIQELITDLKLLEREQ